MTATAPHEEPRRARAACVVVAIVAVIIAANVLNDWVAGFLQIELSPRNEPIVHRLLMISAAAYTLLIAVPFVPGVEIAFSIILLFGPKIVFLLYLCTLAGLSLSFFAGFLIPAPALQRLLFDLSLRRASAFVAEIDGMNTAQRLDHIVARSPRRLIPHLLRYRYVAAALAFNIPGNSVIGGGGGIAFMAGVSRLFSPPAFLATLAIAISPVPLAVQLFGEGILVR